MLTNTFKPYDTSRRYVMDASAAERIEERCRKSMAACDESLEKVRPHNRMDIEFLYQEARRLYEQRIDVAGPEGIHLEMAAQQKLKAGHALYWDIPGTYDPRLEATTFLPWTVERSRVFWARKRGEKPSEYDLEACRKQDEAYIAGAFA